MDQLLVNKKIRVLALCDSPTSATGFAQVSKNILNGLTKTGRYEFDVIGINFFGDAYDRTKFPYNIYPAMPQGYYDVYGRERFLQTLNGDLAQYGIVGPWDLIFTIQDSFVIEGMGINVAFGDQIKVSQMLWKRVLAPEKWFKWIGYFPVDSDLKGNWVRKGIALPDYTVAYCEWGKKKILEHDKKEFETFFNLKDPSTNEVKHGRLVLPALKERVDVVHHGVDLNVFKPLSIKEKQEFRKSFFGNKIKDDTYLVINVSRNQPRKDLARTLKAFAEFKKRVPNSHLYLHSKSHDVGGSIEEVAHNFGLIIGRDYSVPANFDSGLGFGVDIVNGIYNIADLCITTTLGEGWGFITSEAMATKTPIVAPYITSIIDIFGGKEGDEWVKTMRGIPVSAGSTSSEWICLGLSDNERVRPLTNVEDMVEKMYWAYEHKNSPELHDMIERAYEWVQHLSWDTIVKQWDGIFSKAYAELENERVISKKLTKDIATTGRNELCPCGSGKKFKNCHLKKENLDKISDYLVK